MELIVGGLIVTQIVGAYFTYRTQRSLLHAVMSKTTSEFIKMEEVPKRKIRRPQPIQEDAGIPFGL